MPQEPNWLDSRVKPSQVQMNRMPRRKDPTLTQKIIAGGLRTVPALVGGGLGLLAGAPTLGLGSGVLGALGGAAGGGVGEGLAEWYEREQGLRDEYNPTQIAVQTALGTLPGFTKLPGVGTGMKELGKYALKAGGEGALMNVASEFPTEWAETGGLPSLSQLGSSAAIGGVVGAGAGAGLGRYAQTRPVPAVQPPGVTNKLSYSASDMNGPAPPPGGALAQSIHDYGATSQTVRPPATMPLGNVQAPIQGPQAPVVQQPFQQAIRQPEVLQQPVQAAAQTAAASATEPIETPIIPRQIPFTAPSPGQPQQIPFTSPSFEKPIQPRQIPFTVPNTAPPFQQQFPFAPPNAGPQLPAVDPIPNAIPGANLPPPTAPVASVTPTVSQPAVQRLQPADVSGNRGDKTPLISKEIAQRFPGISAIDAKRLLLAEQALESAMDENTIRATGIDAPADYVNRQGPRGDDGSYQADYIPPNVRKAQEDFEKLNLELEQKYGEKFTDTVSKPETEVRDRRAERGKTLPKGRTAEQFLRDEAREGRADLEKKKPALREVSPAREKYVESKVRNLLKKATERGDKSGINTYTRLLDRITNPDLDIPGKYGIDSEGARTLDRMNESEWRHLEDELDYPGISSEESELLYSDRHKGFREDESEGLAGPNQNVKELHRQRFKDDVRERYPLLDEEQNEARANIDRVTGEIIEPDVKPSTLEPYATRVAKITKRFPEISETELRAATDAQTRIDHLERTGQDATELKARLKKFGEALKQKYGSRRPISDSEAPREGAPPKEDRVLEPETLAFRNNAPMTQQSDLLLLDMLVKKLKGAKNVEQARFYTAKLEELQKNLKAKQGPEKTVRERAALSDRPVTDKRKPGPNLVKLETNVTKAKPEKVVPGESFVPPKEDGDVDTTVVPEGAIQEGPTVTPPAVEEPAPPPTTARAKVSINDAMKSVALSIEERIKNLESRFPGIDGKAIHHFLDIEDTLARVVSKRGANVEAHAEKYRALVTEYAGKYKVERPDTLKVLVNKYMAEAEFKWPNILKVDALEYARLRAHYDRISGGPITSGIKDLTNRIEKFSSQLNERYSDKSIPYDPGYDPDFDPDLEPPPASGKKKKSAKEVRTKSQETQKGKRKGKAGKGGSKAMAVERDSDRVAKSEIIPESELIYGDGDEDVFDEINKIELDQTPDDGANQEDLFGIYDEVEAADRAVREAVPAKAVPKAEAPPSTPPSTPPPPPPTPPKVTATGGSSGGGGKPKKVKKPIELANIVGKVGGTLRRSAWYRKFMEENPVFKSIMDPFIKTRASAKLRGEAVRKRFKHLEGYSVDDMLKFEDEYQKGGHQDVHDYFEEIYKVLDRNKIPTEHRGRYLPQRWENWENLVQQGSKNIKAGKSTFQHQTVFPSYATGMQGGMGKPAYSPLELIENYAQEATKKLADTRFLRRLEKAGYIIKAGKDTASKIPGHFKRFDKEISGFKGYYADPSVHEVISNYLSDTSGNFFSKVDRAFGKLANMMLSAGVPFAPALTYRGQSIARPFTGRAWLADGIKGQIDAIRLGFGTKKSKAVLEADAEMRAKFASKAGYTDTTVDVPPTAHFFEDYQGKNKFKKAVNKATGWQYQMFEKPLLESYVPALKWLSTKRFYEKAIKSGMNDVDAMHAAVKHGNDFFGGHNLDLLYNNKHFNTFVRMTILSPSWLRTNMAIGKGMIQAMNPKSNMSKVERRHYMGVYGKLVGAYVAGNLLQKSLTGKYMAENEPGHKFDLVVGKDSLGRERRTKLFNTSADAFELAGEMAGSTMDALGGHEYANPMSEFGSYFSNRVSVPLNIGKGITSGQDYMGRPNLLAKIGRYGEPVDYPEAALNTAFQTLGYGPQQIHAPLAWASGFVPGVEPRMGWEEMMSRLTEAGVSYGKGAKPKGSGKKQFGSGMQVMEPEIMKKMKPAMMERMR